MKTLHNLNSRIANILMFMKSQSGNAFTLFVVFLFDLCTNALGIQMFFAQRLAASLKGLGISPAVAYGISFVVSAFASSALGLAIMQATLNNMKKTGFILSLLSVSISVAGLAHVGIEVQSVQELYTFSNMVRIVMIMGLGIFPPIVYNMNASLIVSEFGPILDKFNKTNVNILEKSIENRTQILSQLDEKKTEVESEIELNKIETKKKRVKRQPQKVKQETKGTTNIEDIIERLKTAQN